MVKHYIRGRVLLNQKTILTCARTYYRDEHGSEPPSGTLGSSWYQRYIDRHGLHTTVYDSQCNLRLNLATPYVRNFFERLARTAVKHTFATWNPDFDENDPSREMIFWDQSKLGHSKRCIRCICYGVSKSCWRGVGAVLRMQQEPRCCRWL